MTESFDYESFPRRLNLGCGFDRREGYLNVDLQAFHEPDLIADVTRLPMLPDHFYEEIQAIDVLEHLPRISTEAVLKEWRRLLLPGGLLSLRVPSLEGLTELFRQSDSFDRHQELMQCLFGTQAYTGDFHLTSFTRVLLTTFLTRSGFSVLSWRLRDEWLFEVVAAPSVREGRDDRSVAMDDRGLEQLLSRCVASGTDDHQFLDAVYSLLLGRSPDPEGAAFYLHGLETQIFDRDHIVRSLRDSEEYSATLPETKMAV